MASVSAVERSVRTGLVWLLGARLPRHVLNVSLLGLAIALAIRPSFEVLFVVVVILFP